MENKLKFALTSDQLNAINEIESDTFSTKIMSRLLQGDVGSGKTIVAFLSMLNYVENKKQCVLMVPTSILAVQHYEYISKLCEDTDVRVGMLTGKIKGKKREKIIFNNNLLFFKLKSCIKKIYIFYPRILLENSL